MKPVVHLLGGACFAFEIVSLQRLMYNSLPLQAGLTIRYASVVDNLCFLLLFACPSWYFRLWHIRWSFEDQLRCACQELHQVETGEGSNEIRF